MKEMQEPTLKIVFVNEFGDKTVIKKTLSNSRIDAIVMAIRESLAGIGFSYELIDEYLTPEE